ncbi:MAG: hypothetical protein ACQERN_04355 [Thermodesulfobacteriota bacterium]
MSTQLGHPRGDYMFATQQSGTWDNTFSGIHVYRLDEAPAYPPDLATGTYRTPNGLTPPYPPNADSKWSSVDYYRYWGVFLTDWEATSPDYTVEYHYAGNPMVPDAESEQSSLGLARRDQYCDRTWADSEADLDTGANTLTKTGETGTEYILGGTDAPLYTDLVRFSATPCESGNCIRIRWETATEIDMVGFRLLRSDGSDGKYVPIPDSFTAAAAVTETGGAVYEYLDYGVDAEAAGKTDYILEAEDIYPSTENQRFGPISVAGKSLDLSDNGNGADHSTSSGFSEDDDTCFIRSIAAKSLF